MMKLFHLMTLLIFVTTGGLAQDKYTYYQNLARESKKLKGLAAGCQVGESLSIMDLNNARYNLRMDGVLWIAEDGGRAGYEIPKGSGKTAIYSGGLWISGVDQQGIHKQCAIKFVGGRNFFPGPLITAGEQQAQTSLDICYQYDKIYQISRFEVEKFRSWHHASPEEKLKYFQDYSIPDAILEWPAHANVAAGYDHYLAPFYDQDEDGWYNPTNGDYPFYDLNDLMECNQTRDSRIPHLYGDLTSWWVMNDNGNIHRNPGGEAIGLEIRAQSFQISEASQINDMSFYHYELINRSGFTLFDTYVGLYLDADLGYGYDDYVGCDVGRGLGYFYNGKEVDGEGESWSYGDHPPAIGFDFFEGPYKTPNGQDDCSSYDENGNLICNECILNGNINGLNYGDLIVDNERLGMTNSMIFPNYGGTGPMPSDLDYYRYLRSILIDNSELHYFGNGHVQGGATGPKTRYMFPGTSDPCGWGQDGIPMPEWSEETENWIPGDRRMIISSGPFIMEPGAVNDITFGTVWAQAENGDRLESVEKMLLADDKAQKLFEHCFKVIDGPDAPELTIIEGDQKLIFHIWNKPGSNNYLESYQERDPFIVCPPDVPDCDLNYTFQGYQIWQVKNIDVSLSEALSGNPDLARLVFQCDIRDGVSEIINYIWDTKLHGTIPQLMVRGQNTGVRHTFEVEKDLFAGTPGKLVNFKDYYYLAVAYAHNNYKTYDQTNPRALDGQKEPYKASRKGAEGPIRIYQVSPHKTDQFQQTPHLNASYGSSVMVEQIEGHGNGGNVLDLTQETIDDIMEGSPWKANTLEYQIGKGPIMVEVIDPLNCPPAEYEIRFDSVHYFKGPGKVSGKLSTASWYIVQNKRDTISSDYMIHRNNQQVFPSWGIAITVHQAAGPYESGAIRQGFLEASIEFSDPDRPWLRFVADDDRNCPANWIRSGDGNLPTGGLYPDDPEEVFENILDGTWAPFYQCYAGYHGVAYSPAQEAIKGLIKPVNSIDLVITPDRSKWTRSPVIETTDYDELSIGEVDKFDLRSAPSIDQYGRPAEPGAGPDSLNIEAPNYISDTGMGWFPGFVINTETGERLNIVYGESSWLTGDHGSDMLWNPSPREGSKLYEAFDGQTSEGVYFGGKHFIYIMQHHDNGSNYQPTWFPAYDEGRYFMDKIDDRISRYRKRELFSNAMWVGIPLLNEDFFDEEDIEVDPYGFIGCEVHIRIRVASPFSVSVNDLAKPDSLALNGNKPMYAFSTAELGTIRLESDTETLLSRIHVVPNPWYGNGYVHPEKQDDYVKIINLPEECTISIYTLNGNLVRRLQHQSDQAYAEWDIRNSSGMPVSGGVYIFHIDCPGLGERIIKWFGVTKQ